MIPVPNVHNAMAVDIFGMRGASISSSIIIFAVLLAYTGFSTERVNIR